jgi:DNA-directed RNA polymerase specialized sigma24 family protein
MESNALQLTWPNVEATYDVPEGRIDLDVHEAAGKVLRRAAGFAMRMLNDEGIVIELMYTAAAKVTEARSNKREAIKNLTHYLHRTYLHLLCDYWKQQSRSQQLSGDLVDEFVRLFASVNVLEDCDNTRAVERRRLVDEIVEQMDDWTFETYDLLVAGYTFEEIARAKDDQSNRIRAKYHRRMRMLARKMRRTPRP